MSTTKEYSQSASLKELFEGKIILVTGGTGSIGSEIVRHLLAFNPKQIRVFDNRETEGFHFQHQLADHKNVRFLIGDTRDKDRLRLAMEHVDIVFHAAALKHVPSCEYNPFEAVKTNVFGTQNVIDCALHCNVEKVINISTDKVTNTINTMGATKLLAERLISAAEHYRGKKRTIFSSVRFGNVLRSRGSVLDLFEEQIKRGGPVTITDYEMTRFFMLIPQAVELVFKAAQLSTGGEIFIFKMPTIKLSDLVNVVIDEIAPKYGKTSSQIEHKVIGIRPGERLHEELMTIEEADHALETDELFIVLPSLFSEEATLAMKQNYSSYPRAPVKSYSSQLNRSLNQEEVRALLRGAKLVN